MKDTVKVLKKVSELIRQQTEQAGVTQMDWDALQTEVTAQIEKEETHDIDTSALVLELRDLIRLPKVEYLVCRNTCGNLDEAAHYHRVREHVRKWLTENVIA